MIFDELHKLHFEVYKIPADDGLNLQDVRLKFCNYEKPKKTSHGHLNN